MELCPNFAKGEIERRRAVAHNQVGIAYMMIGKFDHAVKRFQQSIDLLKSVSKCHIDMVRLPSANLGFAYWLWGMLDEAEDTFSSCLREIEDHPKETNGTSYK